MRQKFLSGYTGRAIQRTLYVDTTKNMYLDVRAIEWTLCVDLKKILQITCIEQLALCVLENFPLSQQKERKEKKRSHT